ncbi:MAG TPA: VOC family protein [Planctomycetota bacterium]|nr:VOC family protein [Planctomycetota bacterium]
MFKGICYVYEAVESLARSREFFESKLGFKLHTNQGRVNGFGIGPGYLVVEEGKPVKAKERGAGVEVCVLVEDVDEYHRTLSGRGVAVGALTDRHWGQRDFYVTDPDGYTWCFAQGTKG